MRERVAHGLVKRLFWAATAILTGLYPWPVSSQELTDSYATVKQSLALIAYPSGKGFITSSAFCIGTDSARSYFITNAHVVGDQPRVGVFLARDPSKPVLGTVIRVNPKLDAAVVAIDLNDVPPLRLAGDRLREGHAVAIAGYPSAHIKLAMAGLGLVPSVHAGIVNSYPADGYFLEFDAQIEHGNSGGPVFDPENAIVYGIVTLKIGADQTNLAIVISQLFEFLNNAHVAIQLGTPQSTAATPQAALPGGVERGRSTPAPSTVAHEVFPTYIPLENRTQNYDCGAGNGFTIDIRSLDGHGNYLVTQKWTGPQFSSQAPISTVQAHDQDNDVILIGFIDSNEQIQRLSPPPIALPIRPSTVFRAQIPSQVGGASYLRTWLGSSTVQLSLGDFPVELYADVFGDVRALGAYSDHVGLVASVVMREGSAPIECSLTSIQK